MPIPGIKASLAVYVIYSARLLLNVMTVLLNNGRCDDWGYQAEVKVALAVVFGVLE